MNIQKQALILTLTLVGFTSMSYAGLKPALAEQTSTQGQQQSGTTPTARQQHQLRNHQTNSPTNQSASEQHRSRPEKPENHARNGQNSLNLSDAQKAQIQQIQEAARQKINAVYTSEQQAQIRTARQQHQKVKLTLSAEQKTQIQAINQETQRLMKGVLTAEQQQKLQAQHSSEGFRHQQQSSN
ncbi:MAG: hypothetical protein ACM37W_25270 [Actinomycetota bacterium]